MNNISLWEILYPQKLRTNRIYKIMKITLTLVFVSIFSMFAGNIHSQNARITFTKNNATLESVLNEIENQTPRPRFFLLPPKERYTSAD